MGICFNGYEDVDTAISECTKEVGTLQPAKWLSIGGNGAPHGVITPDVLSSAASSGDTIIAAGYAGVIFDVEVAVGTNDALVSGFTSASQTLTSKGLQVGVTTSHSGPVEVSGGADAATLVKCWVADPNMAVLSPQLYTTGEEDTPDFDTTASCSACTWELWQGSSGAFAPSIVTASQYDEVSTYFSSEHGITTGGYIQWQQSPSPAPDASKMCGATWDEASSKCSKSCPGGLDGECDQGQKCWGGISACPTTMNHCGKDYADASSKCGTECPGGLDSECDMGSGEKCWGGIKCGNFCGPDWSGASACAHSCPGGLDSECPDGQTCFGGISCST
ncbi:unnamed protein product [Prorocentrum cordatum]|uniref:Subtilisin n=1 Tax=Prorocentrum cordatum TaxID=2364126 RepID=A0ABN9Q1C0_9DINO|nr:unnamed protein product [Polarella glacialis]